MKIINFTLQLYLQLNKAFNPSKDLHEAALMLACISCLANTLWSHPTTVARLKISVVVYVRKCALNFLCFGSFSFAILLLLSWHLCVCVCRCVWASVCVCASWAQLIKTLLGLVMVVSLCGRRFRRPRRLAGKLCQSVWRCLLLLLGLRLHLRPWAVWSVRGNSLNYFSTSSQRGRRLIYLQLNLFLLSAESFAGRAPLVAADSLEYI